VRIGADYQFGKIVGGGEADFDAVFASQAYGAYQIPNLNDTGSGPRERTPTCRRKRVPFICSNVKQRIFLAAAADRAKTRYVAVTKSIYPGESWGALAADTDGKAGHHENAN
jgi:hypothetical protein